MIAATPAPRTIKEMVTQELRTIDGLVVPNAAMRWEFSRASGAGGQHVNKTASRAALVIEIGLIEGSQELRTRVLERLGAQLRLSEASSRSQWRNRRTLLERAKQQLEEATKVAPARRPTRPTRAAQESRLGAKRHRSSLKASRRIDPD